MTYRPPRFPLPAMAALRALAFLAAAACSAWVPAASAADEPPTLRVHRVGDIDFLVQKTRILRGGWWQGLGDC